MTTDELLELERLAKKATPGVWRMGYPYGQCFKKHVHKVENCHYQITGYGESTSISIDVPPMSPVEEAPFIVSPDEYNEGPRVEDAAYIVAAQPIAMLALIERLRHLEQTLEAEREVLASFTRDLNPHDALALGQRLEAIHMQWNR